MAQVIQKNEATAKYRRVPILIYSDTDGVTPWAGSVTGVKAQLSWNGNNNAGSLGESASSADIVRVGGAVHYVELTQAEADEDDGEVVARVAAASGRLEGVGSAAIVNYDPRAAGSTPADIADAVWDEILSGHTTVGSAGQRMQSLRTGTAQAGAASTITLDAGASATDDFYNHALILITSGQGSGQVRTISDYVGSSKVASVSVNWAATPNNTSVFVIIPTSAIAGATAPTAVEIRDAIFDAALPELTGVPPVNNATFKQAVQWVFHRFRNKRRTTNTSRTIFRADGSTNLASSTLSDDGTNFEETAES